MLVTNFLYRACQISTVLKATSDDESAIPGYLYVEVCSILFMIFLRFNYHFREFWSASLLFDSVICINNLFFWESYHVVIGFFFIADILNLSFIYVYLTYTWMNYVFFLLSNEIIRMWSISKYGNFAVDLAHVFIHFPL